MAATTKQCAGEKREQAPVPATTSAAASSEAEAAPGSLLSRIASVAAAGGSFRFTAISMVATYFLVRFVVIGVYADVNALAASVPYADSWLTWACNLTTAHLGPARVWAISLGEELPAETLRLINRGVFATWVGYAAMGLVATALDLWPARFQRYKVQGAKNYFTAGEWCEAFGLSTFNVLCASWALNVPLACLGLWLHGDGAAVEADAWVWYREIPKFIACLPIVDCWFYWTHRLIHVPRIYRAIHKLHHRFKAPTAVASMYAHPLEFLVGNLTGVALGPVLTNCHPYTAYYWFCYALVSTGGSHSGYSFFDAQSHDRHHEFFNCNFGVGGMMDALMGTTYEAWRAKREGADKKLTGKAD